MSHSPYLNHTTAFTNKPTGFTQNYDQTTSAHIDAEGLNYNHRLKEDPTHTEVANTEKDNISYLIMPLNIISAGLCIAAFGLGVVWFGWPDQMSLLFEDVKSKQTSAPIQTPPKIIKKTKSYYSAQLSGQTFLITGENLRQIHRDEAGNARRIDLLAKVTPKEEEIKSAQRTAAIEKNKIYISISHIAATTTPETRLETTYKHHLADEGVATSLGLTLYRFKDESGYGDQELYTGTLQDGPYVSVCFDEMAGLNASRCLASIPVGSNLVARYSFDRSHIKNWTGINQKVRDVVFQMKVSK